MATRGWRLGLRGDGASRQVRVCVAFPKATPPSRTSTHRADGRSTGVAFSLFMRALMLSLAQSTMASFSLSSRLWLPLHVIDALGIARPLRPSSSPQSALPGFASPAEPTRPDKSHHPQPCPAVVTLSNELAHPMSRMAASDLSGYQNYRTRPHSRHATSPRSLVGAARNGIHKAAPILYLVREGP